MKLTRRLARDLVAFVSLQTETLLGVGRRCHVGSLLLLGSAFTLGNLLAAGLVPFLASLLGGYLGERHQSGGAAVSR